MPPPFCFSAIYAMANEDAMPGILRGNFSAIYAMANPTGCSPAFRSRFSAIYAMANSGAVTIPRQSRGLSIVSRSKRLDGVANAAPHSLRPL